MTATLKRYRIWIFEFLIAAIAIFLRVYAIDRLPPGLFGDEAVEGLDALDVLAGNFAIRFQAHLGREPLFVYLVALSYRAFGVTPLATPLAIPQLLWVAGFAQFSAVLLLLFVRATMLLASGRWEDVQRLLGPRTAQQELDEVLHEHERYKD